MRWSSRSAWKHALLVCLAMTPFGWGVWGWSHPSRLSDVPPGEPLPSLVFDQYLLDLRRVPQQPSEKLHFYFPFRNMGKGPLSIGEMKGSCGCLRPILTRSNPVYKPGEAGEILLTIQTANQAPGEQEFSVDVNYTDPVPRSRQVKLKVVLPKEQVTVRPRSLMMFTSNSHQDLPPQVITVEDPRSQPLTVLGATCDNEFVSIEMVPDKGPRDGGKMVAKLRVALKSPVPSGRHSTLVHIFTDDPSGRYHELKVPLMILSRDLPVASRVSAELD